MRNKSNLTTSVDWHATLSDQVPVEENLCIKARFEVYDFDIYHSCRVNPPLPEGVLVWFGLQAPHQAETAKSTLHGLGALSALLRFQRLLHEALGRQNSKVLVH